MATVDIFLYEGLTPDTDVELSDPTQLRTAGRFPYRVLPPLWATLDAWRPKDPLPWHGRYLVQEFVQADDPPFGFRNPIWLGLPKWQERRLTPLLIGHSIFAPPDPPIRVSDPSLWTILRAWEPGPSRELWNVRGPFVFRIPEDPPFGLKTNLWSILAAWQPRPPLPWHGIFAPQEFVVTPDNPPFGLKNPLWPIIASWQPGPPLPWHRYVYVIQETVVTP